MYIALTYIGRDFTPGEVLPDGMDEKLIHRLLKAGAIRETAPAPAAFQVKTEPVPDETVDMPDEAEAEEAEDALEPEPPVLDVSAALVDAEEEKPKASRKRGGSRS